MRSEEAVKADADTLRDARLRAMFHAGFVALSGEGAFAKVDRTPFHAPDLACVVADVRTAEQWRFAASLADKVDRALGLLCVVGARSVLASAMPDDQRPALLDAPRGRCVVAVIGRNRVAHVRRARPFWVHPYTGQPTPETYDACHIALANHAMRAIRRECDAWLLPSGRHDFLADNVAVLATSVEDADEVPAPMRPLLRTQSLCVAGTRALVSAFLNEAAAEHEILHRYPGTPLVITCGSGHVRLWPSTELEPSPLTFPLTLSRSP